LPMRAGHFSCCFPFLGRRAVLFSAGLRPAISDCFGVDCFFFSFPCCAFKKGPYFCLPLFLKGKESFLPNRGPRPFPRQTCSLFFGEKIFPHCLISFFFFVWGGNAPPLSFANRRIDLCVVLCGGHLFPPAPPFFFSPPPHIYSFFTLWERTLTSFLFSSYIPRS